MNACIICKSGVANGELFCTECSKFALKYERRCKKCGAFTLNPELSDCYLCKGKKFYFDAIFSHFIYSGAVAMAISSMKYGKVQSFAEVMGKYIALNTPYEIVKGRTVIFPPMRFFDKLIRGFNQAEIFADRVSLKYKLKLDASLLKKVKKTRQQASLTYEERQTNLNGAFQLTRDVKGESFLIVDDVCTTGSTINEISKLLKHNKAKSVNAVTLARTSPYFS